MCSIRYFSEQCCAEQERGGGGVRNSVGHYPRTINYVEEGERFPDGGSSQNLLMRMRLCY